VGWGGWVLALSQALTPLPRSVAAAVGVLTLVGFVSEGIWRLARHISVIAHEGAHATAGRVMGGRVTSVVLQSNADGETRVAGLGGLAYIIYLFVGYLGPSACGLAAAGLIALGYIKAVLWLGVIFIAVMLLVVRNLFGVVSVVLNGGLLFLALRYGNANLQTFVAYSLSWFMLFAGVRWVLSDHIGAGDAFLLRGATYVPRIVWFAMWLAGSIAALWLGSRLLLR